MSRKLLCVVVLLLVEVTYAVTAPPSSRHVSIEQPLANGLRTLHVASVRHSDEGKGDGDLEARQSEPAQTDLQTNGTQQSEPLQSEPQQSEPQQSEPQRSEPQQGESKQSEPHKSEPHQGESKQSESKQSESKQSEPQQSAPNPSESQQNETTSDSRTQPDDTVQLHQPPQAAQAEKDASPSKESVQPPFNPSVSTVGFVGAIATVIVAAFLVWSKSSNNSMSPVQLASHAYQRVRTNAQDTNISAQSSADADGWNAGWDDDEDWNPEPPSAKV